MNDFLIELYWNDYHTQLSKQDLVTLLTSLCNVTSNYLTFKLNELELEEQMNKHITKTEKNKIIYHETLLKKRVYNLTTRIYHEQGSQEWLDDRKKVLSASDAGTAVGKNHYETVNELILKKCDKGPKFVGNIYTEHGHKYEDVAAQLYQTTNLIDLYFFGLCLHKNPRIPIGASPDGIRKDGVMLEIKVPYSRKITGIVPEHYYVQTQVQMEVCELEENDFYETRIEEFECADFYHMDGSDRHTDKGKIKGMIGQFYHVKTGKNKFVYPPMWCSSNEMEKWINNQVQIMKKSNPDYKFDTIIYWRQEVESCVRVNRNRKEMHEEFVPIFQDVWKKILYHRKTNGKELNYLSDQDDVTKDDLPFAFENDSDAD